MTSANRGLLIILSGPAGSGKTTFARKLCEASDRCVLSVSATTRAPRPGEVDGRDYFFYDRAGFEAAIAEDAFAEYAEFSGHLYGTPRSFLDAHRAAGQHVVLDIEVQGAAALRADYPDAVDIFLLPPTPEDLVRRLRGRGTEDDAEIRRRLDIARREVEALDASRYFVCTDAIDPTFAVIRAIVTAEERRVRGGEREAWYGDRRPEDALQANAHV